jgi:hypothetical protein
MNIHILFIQRKEPYPGAYAPEVLLAWDGGSVEANPDEFAEACAIALKDAKDAAADPRPTMVGDIIAHEIILIEVNQDAIRKRLIGQMTTKGLIVPKTE